MTGIQFMKNAGGSRRWAADWRCPSQRGTNGGLRFGDARPDNAEDNKRPAGQLISTATHSHVKHDGSIIQTLAIYWLLVGSFFYY